MTVCKDPRLKILILNGSMQVGGAELQLARLAPLFDRTRYDIRVAYYNDEAGLPREMLLASDIPVRHLGSVPWSKRGYFEDAVSWMRHEQFDLVHAWSASANLYARLPAILARVPLIIGGLRGKSGMEGWRPFLYSLMNLCTDGWIVNSQAIAAYAMSKMFFLRNCPIKIIQNGFNCTDNSIFKREEQTPYDQCRKGVPVVGIVGRLHPVKGHGMFLDMVKRLTAEGVDAEYWIIGDGPERTIIEQTLRKEGLTDRVRLWGMRHDVDAALCRMDLFVLTSLSESCPNVLLEAMRASLPVIATQCTSLDQIIDEGRNGYVVPIGDSRSLALRVKELLADRERRVAFGAASRQIVEEGFSLSRAAKDLEQSYLYFLKRARAKDVRIDKKMLSMESSGFVDGL